MTKFVCVQCKKIFDMKAGIWYRSYRYLSGQGNTLSCLKCYKKYDLDED